MVELIKKKFSLVRFGLVALPLWLVLSACGPTDQTASAPLPSARQSQEAQLLERATALWEAHLIGDRITAYQFESISVNESVKLHQYAIRGGGIRYLKADVTGAELASEPDKAWVHINVEYQLPGFSADILSKRMRQEWVTIDGQWYHRWRSFTDNVRDNFGLSTEQGS